MQVGVGKQKMGMNLIDGDWDVFILHATFPKEFQNMKCPAGDFFYLAIPNNPFG